MPKKSWSYSVTKAVNVSAAFDNCFFHSYVLHLYANNLPLPADLFTFKSVAGVDSPASKLQARFPNENSLSLFANYANIAHPNAYPANHQFIMEKTIVIGILMREWFATKMAEHNKLGDDLELQQDVVGAFNGYKNCRDVLTDEELFSSENGLYYKANHAFLEYFAARSNKGRLPREEEHFEKYFENRTPDEAIIAYWKEQGLQPYCKELAKLETKVTYKDVAWIMNMVLQQPFNVYSSSKEYIILYSSDTDGNSPVPEMHILFQAGAGHYKLLRTGKNKDLLNEYVASSAQYDKCRSNALEHTTLNDKLKAARETPALFVEATFNKAELGSTPRYELLINRVDSLKEAITKSQYKYANQLLKQRHEGELELFKKKISPLKKSFMDSINKLEKKLYSFPLDSDPYRKVHELCTNLRLAGNKFFENIEPGTYREFRSNCETYFKNASSILGSHRGWAKLITSVLAVVASCGLALGIDLAMHKGKFTLFSTDSALKMDELQEQVTALSPLSPMLKSGG